MYSGSWENGVQQGFGFYTNKNGVKKEGYWDKGKRIRWVNEGKGKETAGVEVDNKDTR